ncbi:MAG: 3-(3-hydroxy-phenyl)propionate transporter MhpT [Pseudomonadota bacterium]|nr:3-(3-hydroxy-phenyl)propionate transporter MhpT [Pseudomonadota bacterium]
MERVESSRSSTVAFFLCLITAIFEGADNVSLGLAAPRVAKELGLHPSQMGLALSASLIGLMLGSFLGGRLADWVGRKRVLIISMATLGVFSLATTVARGFTELLLLRFVVGLGIGGAFPILIAMASETSSPGRRAGAIGLVYSGQPLGAALLSLLVSLLGVTVNWRAIFYVGGFGPLLLVPLLMVFLPESTAFREARSKGAAHSAAAQSIGSVLFGQGRAAATVLLWVSCAFTLFVVYVLLNWIPSLMLGKGLNGPQGSMVSMTLNLGGAVGVLVFGAIVDKGFHKPAIIGCYLVLLLSLAGLAALSAYPLMLIFAGFAGLSMLGSQLVLYSLAADYYPTLCRGTGLGAMVSVGRIGGVTAPFAAGLLLSAGYDAKAVLSTAVACVFIAAALAVVLLAHAPPARLERP